MESRLSKWNPYQRWLPNLLTCNVSVVAAVANGEFRVF